MAEQVRNLSTMQEVLVQFLGQEDLLKKGMATQSSSLALKIPRTEKPGKLWFIGLQRVGHDRSDLAHMHSLLTMLW